MLPFSALEFQKMLSYSWNLALGKKLMLFESSVHVPSLALRRLSPSLTFQKQIADSHLDSSNKTKRRGHGSATAYEKLAPMGKKAKPRTT